MTRASSRRDELAEAATDYVLRRGLIGLSLRPLAAELGTSDRMLLYHFGTRDELVAAVLHVSNARSVAEIERLPPSADVRTAVVDLWQAMRTSTLSRCQRMYVEAAALGLFGKEPYASVVREANRVWVRAVSTHFADSGVPSDAAERVTALLDAAFSGFMLDLPLDGDDPLQHQAIEDLADAIAAIASGAGAQVRVR